MSGIYYVRFYHSAPLQNNWNWISKEHEGNKIQLSSMLVEEEAPGGQRLAKHSIGSKNTMDKKLLSVVDFDFNWDGYWSFQVNMNPPF